MAGLAGVRVEIGTEQSWSVESSPFLNDWWLPKDLSSFPYSLPGLTPKIHPLKFSRPALPLLTAGPRHLSPIPPLVSPPAFLPLLLAEGLESDSWVPAMLCRSQAKK